MLRTGLAGYRIRAAQISSEVVRRVGQGGLRPPLLAGSSWHYAWLNLSVADMIVVALMLVVFALALILRWPGEHS